MDNDKQLKLLNTKYARNKEVMAALENVTPQVQITTPEKRTYCLRLQKPP